MLSRTSLGCALLLCAAVSTATFWMEEIGRFGISPYHPQGVNYQVFRSVKDFGAVGDGGMLAEP